MGQIVLHGTPYSVYTRIARLVLEEAGVPYELVEVDIFDTASVSPDYRQRHPFEKVPALDHDGFRLFETDAIAQYVVAAFDARGLMPEAPRERARTLQIMRIADNYAYPRLVWGVYVEEVERDRAGQLDATESERALHVLTVLEGLAGRPFLIGEGLALADLWVAAMLAYLRLAPSGNAMLDRVPRLRSWLDLMLARPSLVATRYPAEGEPA